VELRGSLPSYLAERESVADLLRDGRRLAVHVVELEGGSWRASLAFRDALRADESLCAFRPRRTLVPMMADTLGA
jgi:hypothetical protein